MAKKPKMPNMKIEKAMKMFEGSKADNKIDLAATKKLAKKAPKKK